MIKDCEAGRIDMIITKSISRFSRNTVDCLKYTRKLKEMNIAIFFEKENINTLDAKGEVLMTIMAALAQQESESLSGRTMADGVGKRCFIQAMTRSAHCRTVRNDCMI